MRRSENQYDGDYDTEDYCGSAGALWSSGMSDKCLRMKQEIAERTACCFGVSRDNW